MRDFTRLLPPGYTATVSRPSCVPFDVLTVTRHGTEPRHVDIALDDYALGLSDAAFLAHVLTPAIGCCEFVAQSKR